MPTRLNVTLDDARSAKLDLLADRAHLNPGTLAKSFLSEAIDQAHALVSEQGIASAGPTAMAAILMGIPGFEERFARGMADVEAGRTVPLDQL